MNDYKGATVVITGAASGIGFAMARAFRKHGAQVVLIDIKQDALDTARRSMEDEAEYPAILTLQCDVSNRVEMQAAAAAAKAFGSVRLVCANAGVIGPLDRSVLECTAEDWEWTLGVNLGGVVNTIQAFVPGMLADDVAGHIVLTSSMAGLLPIPGMSPYGASKFAVTGLAETVAAELVSTNVGVSVLCPGYVVTRIVESARNHPDKSTSLGSGHEASQLSDRVQGGSSPAQVAEHLIEALARRDFYIFTDPTMRKFVEKRYSQISFAFDAADRSSHLLDEYR